MSSAPPSDGRKELYAEVLKGKNVRRYKITVKSKNNQPADAVKKIIKSCIDPLDMNIGIRTFMGLKDWKVLIEADTKDDIKILNTQIRGKCGDRLVANVQKRRNPRIIIYIPEEVTLENAEEIICAQNELALNKGDITPKFIFETKKLGNQTSSTNPEDNVAKQTKNQLDDMQHCGLYTCEQVL